MRLKRKVDEQAQVTANAKQALMMADEATKSGNEVKAAQYQGSAQTFATRLVTIEAEVADLKGMVTESAEAAEAAKVAVDQNSRLLQKKLAERQRLLSQLDQVKMRESMNKAMASLSDSVGAEAPTLDEVREKIEIRYAQAKGVGELQGASVANHTLEVEAAAQDTKAQARLAELRFQLGLDSATAADSIVLTEQSRQEAN